MALRLKRRQKLILKALVGYGGEATTRQISEKTGLNVNGVSQSLGALAHHVVRLGGKGGDTKWQLKNDSLSFTMRSSIRR
ncbi:MAG: hypothetical protein AAB727_03220 [Patescibacteria group bacterium]|mgnify:CR=1 FL=1